jgi:LmbE family N-acetylglucosaminyl deacetylase
VVGESIERRTLAAIVAHPDDDAYGISGVVALHADDPALRFVLVHATDGEQGSIAGAAGRPVRLWEPCGARRTAARGRHSVALLTGMNASATPIVD